MFGKYYKNTYIENCYFEGCRHAVTGNFAGAYVLRYSVIEDIALHAVATTGHPVRSGVLGMLTCEIYGNVFRRTGIYSNNFAGNLVESGSGLVYNNRYEGTLNPLVVGKCEVINPEFYPLGDTKEVYFWDNDLTDAVNPTVGINTNAGGTPEEGVEYFTDITGVYTTSQIQGMVDAKSYSQYTYPHPLTLQEFP